MVTKLAPNGFAETRDRIGWALVYAPDFKGRFTLNEVFSDIEHGLGTVKVTLKDAERLGIYDACRTKLAVAKAALAKGEVKGGKQALVDAELLFRSLRRPKAKPELEGVDPGDSAEDTVDD